MTEMSPVWLCVRDCGLFCAPNCADRPSERRQTACRKVLRACPGAEGRRAPPHPLARPMGTPRGVPISRWGVTRLEAIERILTERIRRELTEERQRQLNDHVKRKQPA
jgi:hypothetical protein